jgi:hypothetical protein
MPNVAQVPNASLRMENRAADKRRRGGNKAEGWRVARKEKEV